MLIDLPAPARVPTRARGQADTDALAVRWREHGERAARQELFDRYLPMARRLAVRYANRHEPVEDLVQVAAVGLLGAIDRFDPGRGVAFPSFAVPTILGELKRYFRNTGWSAHVPRSAKEMALRVDRAMRDMTVETHAPPRVDQLARYLEVSPEEVLEGLHAGAAHHSISLDTPVRADEQDAVTLGDGVGRNDDGYGVVEMRVALHAAVARLPHTERQVLALRLAFDMRQVDIARELGCSQMQVSRLLRRAATRLRELTDPDLADLPA